MTERRFLETNMDVELHQGMRLCVLSLMVNPDAATGELLDFDLEAMGDNGLAVYIRLIPSKMRVDPNGCAHVVGEAPGTWITCDKLRKYLIDWVKAREE